MVAGINGDYYYTGSGIPMGLLVTDGVIRSGYNYTWAVGFMEDGTVIMGDPKLSIKMSYTHTVTEPARFRQQRGKTAVKRPETALFPIPPQTAAPNKPSPGKKP